MCTGVSGGASAASQHLRRRTRTVWAANKRKYRSGSGGEHFSRGYHRAEAWRWRRRRDRNRKTKKKKNVPWSLRAPGVRHPRTDACSRIRTTRMEREPYGRFLFALSGTDSSSAFRQIMGACLRNWRHDRPMEKCLFCYLFILFNMPDINKTGGICVPCHNTRSKWWIIELHNAAQPRHLLIYEEKFHFIYDLLAHECLALFNHNPLITRGIRCPHTRLMMPGLDEQELIVQFYIWQSLHLNYLAFFPPASLMHLKIESPAMASLQDSLLKQGTAAEMPFYYFALHF